MQDDSCLSSLHGGSSSLLCVFSLASAHLLQGPGSTLSLPVNNSLAVLVHLQLDDHDLYITQSESEISYNRAYEQTHPNIVLKLIQQVKYYGSKRTSFNTPKRFEQIFLFSKCWKMN